jgi:Protein of unknown function (DUF3987)
MVIGAVLVSLWAVMAAVPKLVKAHKLGLGVGSALEHLLASGEGKSPAFEAAMRPIEAWEASQKTRWAPVIRDAEMKRDLLEGRIRHAVERASRAKPEDREAIETEAYAAKRELAAHHVPVAPRLIFDDVTPEKLATMLHQHGGRLAIASAEGGIFELMAGRYSKNASPNLDVWIGARGPRTSSASPPSHRAGGAAGRAGSLARHPGVPGSRPPGPVPLRPPGESRRPAAGRRVGHVGPPPGGLRAAHPGAARSSGRR